MGWRNIRVTGSAAPQKRRHDQEPCASNRPSSWPEARRWRGLDTVPEPLLLILHVGYGWLALGLGRLPAEALRRHLRVQYGIEITMYRTRWNSPS